jgi:hypothetical protein
MIALLVSLVLAAAGATVQPAPSPSVTPDVPFYVGNPATHFTVEALPQGFDPDGKARWLLIAHFLDAQNKPTMILANSDLDWRADRGHVQWQNRMRFSGPAAFVLVDTDGPIVATIAAKKPALGTVVVRTDTRTWKEPRSVAEALGPHAVAIGWFPRADAPVRIERISGRRRTVLVTLPTGSSSYRDATVVPGESYRYTIARDGSDTSLEVQVPAALPDVPVSVAAGKGMWLWWSVNPLDDNFYGKLDPNAIVDRAVRAGLHYVELRTAYGAHWLITPEAKPTIDAIVDGLAAHGIAAVGWTVPREVTFEDLSTAMRTIEYRTSSGTPLRGIAIDLERGDDFLGGDPNGLAGLWMYEQALREAAGPAYPIIATVEDPFFEHLDEAKYPYREIARYASVLQPMSYWRMMSRRSATIDPSTVRQMMARVYTTLHEMSGSNVPISIGGQTTAEGRNGYPPADEITASLAGSREAGAIGVCFFDWDGTQPYQWDAMAAYPWMPK